LWSWSWKGQREHFATYCGYCTFGGTGRESELQYGIFKMLNDNWVIRMEEENSRRREKDQSSGEDNLLES